MHNYYQQYYSQKPKIKVAVVGGSGYAGLELVRLLEKHPFATIRVSFSTNEDFKFSDFLPHASARGIPVVPLDEIDKWTKELDTVFLATPPEVSLELAPKLIKAGVNVIDLSGAFRLKEGDQENRAQVYKKYYKFEHPEQDLLESAEYGLVPWRKQTEYRPATLIANPGCYATSVLMALLPLLNRGLIQKDTVVIDSKSGTSGAGRKASQSLLFTEVEGECLPYRVGRHQHLPEIRQGSKAYSDIEFNPPFATHLLPVRRGILSSIYAKLAPGITTKDLDLAYSTDYSDYGLVEWGTLDGQNDRADAYAVSLKRVVGTGLTRIQYAVEGDQLYLFSLIDNLIKGAGGQAIENFNVLHQVPPAVGLESLEGVL